VVLKLLVPNFNKKKPLFVPNWSYFIPPNRVLRAAGRAGDASPHLLQNEIGQEGINRSINLNNICSPLVLSVEYKKDVNCKAILLNEMSNGIKRQHSNS
jgi:hypothetical protein